MRGALLAAAAIAAIALPAAPAQALDPARLQSAASPAGITVHRGQLGHPDDDFRGHRRHDRRRNRGGDSVLIYDRDYQGDTAWRSNSYNDWWHDRPDRAYPRWMESNRDCERMWWSGGGWRC